MSLNWATKTGFKLAGKSPFFRDQKEQGKCRVLSLHGQTLHQNKDHNPNPHWASPKDKCPT